MPAVSTCSPASVRSTTSPAQHEDEFLFMRVPVAHRGFLAGRQRGVVDADLREAQRIAERALLARQDARTIRLRITGTGARRERHGIERGFLQSSCALTLCKTACKCSGMPQMFDDVGEIVEEALRRVGKRVVLALPLGIGKPNLIANEFFRRARADATLDLTIFTALSACASPPGSSDLEKALHRAAGGAHLRQLPGARLPRRRCAAATCRRTCASSSSSSSRARCSTPRTRSRTTCRPTTRTSRASCWHRGVNVIAHVVAKRVVGGITEISLGSNPDVTVDLLPEVAKLRAAGQPVVMLGQVHREMPFMLGAANVGADTFDLLLDHSRYDYDLFAPPNPVAVHGGSRHRPARERAGARRRHAADRHRRARRLHRLFAAAAPPAERSLAARARRRRHRAQRAR